MQRVRRDARGQQNLDRVRGDERRLRRRLGDDGATGGERGGDLAAKNRERKVPRRNANRDAAPAASGRRFDRARCVVAQKIDRLAGFGDGVGNRLAGLAHGERGEIGHVLLEQFRRPRQGFGARGGACRRPTPGPAAGGGERGFDVARRGGRDMADNSRGIGRVADGRFFAAAASPVDERARAAGDSLAGAQRAQERIERGRVVAVDADGVDARGQKNRARQGDFGMGGGVLRDAPPQLGERVFENRF